MPKKVIALGAAGAALAAGGIAFAVWAVLAIISITSSFNTGVLTTAGITAYTPSTCTVVQTSDIWPVVGAAGPGDFASGSICLANTSAASPSITYALTSTNSNSTLGAAEKIRITSAGTTTSAATAAALACTLPNLSTDGVTPLGAQAQVYLGAMQGLAVGNPIAGSQAGDRVLDGSGKFEKLCVTAVLPVGASTTLANQSNDFGLVITAAPN